MLRLANHLIHGLRTQARSVIYGLSFLVVIVLNLTLLRQNLALKDINVVSGERAPVLPAPREGIAKGTRLPALTGTRPDGRDLTVEFRGPWKGTLLIFFSTTCPACDQYFPLLSDRTTRSTVLSMRTLLGTPSLASPSR